MNEFNYYKINNHCNVKEIKLDKFLCTLLALKLNQHPNTEQADSVVMQWINDATEDAHCYANEAELQRYLTKIIMLSLIHHHLIEKLYSTSIK